MLVMQEIDRHFSPQGTMMREALPDMEQLEKMIVEETKKKVAILDPLGSSWSWEGMDGRTGRTERTERRTSDFLFSFFFFFSFLVLHIVESFFFHLWFSSVRPGTHLLFHVTIFSCGIAYELWVLTIVGWMMWGAPLGKHGDFFSFIWTWWKRSEKENGNSKNMVGWKNLKRKHADVYVRTDFRFSIWNLFRPMITKCMHIQMNSCKNMGKETLHEWLLL